MCFEEQVREHERKILGVESAIYRPRCKRCDARTGFVRHGIRRRQFRSVADGNVVSIDSWIVRWKCSCCCFTFTDRPPFALPNKRFVKATVFKLTTDYCEIRSTTYRKPERPQCGSPREESNGIKLAPSNVWRWMCWLNDLWWEASRALRIIQEDDIHSTLHRCVWAVDPCKYRSDARSSVVHSARRSVSLFRIFEARFGDGTSPALQQAAS